MGNLVRSDLEWCLTSTQWKQHGGRHENKVHVKLPLQCRTFTKNIGEVAGDGAEQVIRGWSRKALYVDQMGFYYFFSVILGVLIKRIKYSKCVHQKKKLLLWSHGDSFEWFWNWRQPPQFQRIQSLTYLLIPSLDNYWMPAMCWVLGETKPKAMAMK